MTLKGQPRRAMWVTKGKTRQASFMDVPLYLQVRGIFTNLHIIALTVKSFHKIYKVTLTALPKGD